MGSLFGVVVLVGSGCKSQTVQDAEPLPFHVALIPVETRMVESESTAKGGETDLSLELDGGGFSRELATALDGTCFSKVSLLEPSTSAASAAPREVWLEGAQALNADLVLEATLSYDEEIRTSLNDKFWLNLPLCTRSAAPGTWFVNDRSYHFDVRLDGVRCTT